MDAQILIATDGSPEAREAVEYGLELAEEQQAAATLLQVIPPMDWTLDRGAVIRPIPRELAKRRGIALDEAAALAADMACRCVRGDRRRPGRRDRRLRRQP